MGILRTNTLSGIGTDGPVFDGVTRLDTFGYVVPPVGVTSDRTLVGVTTAQGSIRFNTDSQKLEFYAQDQWWEMVIDTPDLAVSSNTGAGARGVFGGGYTNTPANGDSNSIEYINISSSGNSIDFGDLSWLPRENAAVSSATRGVWCGGYGPAPTLVTTQGYITISSTGNSTSFGSLSQARRLMTGGGNATRGLISGGFAPGNINVNTIDAITIATTGSNFDFGDLLNTIRDHATFASPTRCVLGGGSTPSAVNRIEYITIATQGNSTDFGDLTSVRTSCGGGSNATRGIFAGGGDPSAINIIDYVQISTIGNAVRFGDLTQSGAQIYNLQTSSTRGVRCGGNVTPGFTNTMDYMLIQTQGNAVDFGDLIIPRKSMSGCSNAHGGL